MDGIITTRKKRIFARRDSGRRIKVMLSFAMLMSVAAASFSAGYYVGTSEQDQDLIARAQPAIPQQFIY